MWGGIKWIKDGGAVVAVIAIIILMVIFGAFLYLRDANNIAEYNDNYDTSSEITSNYYQQVSSDKTIDTRRFNILLSEEMKNVAYIIENYAKTKGYNVNIDYAGTLEIMDKLNDKQKYDAIWIANSIWTYMIDSKDFTLSNSKSTSGTPVVFGIKKSKAEELGFVDKTVYTKDLLDAISAGNLKFAMSNPNTTNSGASAYLGMLYTFADNPVVLTEETLNDTEVKSRMKTFFSGLERTSGSEDFLEELFLNGDYEAVFSYESSIISINKELVKQGKEPLYVVYPYDGVPMSDNPFVYVDRKDDKKEAIFLDIQKYLLGLEGKELLAQNGVRTWYGGRTNNADKTIFNEDWGIVTTKNLNLVKYPSSDVIKKALSFYQAQYRKPVHVVFCLDYSGSMYGEGIEQLREAVKYIMSSEAEKDNIQFSEEDMIDVVPFANKVQNGISTENGTDTQKIIDFVNNKIPEGGTNIYAACAKGIELLKNEDRSVRNISIILMTDGLSNNGSMNDLRKAYNSTGIDVPVYSIMFGEADRTQLDEVAKLTNGKVFDGKSDLVKAFKEVRGYN